MFGKHLMKGHFIILLTALVMLGSAQSPASKQSKVTARYEEYRAVTTDPSYGLSKVERLVAKIKPVDSGDVQNEALTDKQFAALSVSEKFTYCMIHAEDFSQNCDMMPVVVGSEKKIFGYPAEAFDSWTWSKRQESFLTDNRPKVIALLRDTIKTHRRVGANLKDAIVTLEAYQLIPDLVRAFNRDKRDLDILSVLLELMEDGKYKPLLESETHRKLYGDGANHQSFIVANPENIALVIARATGYYKTRKG